MGRLLAAAVSLAAFASVGIALADGTPLSGSVGPGFAISLKDAAGAPVKHLDSGAYTLDVNDLSDAHNFHIAGPGSVDVATDVDTLGKKSFAVNLVDGTYMFFCDAHPSSMKGTFTVGSVTTTPTPPSPPTPPTTPPAPLPQLTLTVTNTAVTLKRAGASAVRRLAPGVYVVKAVDRSAKQNAHLIGRGVNRKTGIAFVGTVSWKVTLKAGTLAYRSDAAAPKLRGGKVTVGS